MLKGMGDAAQRLGDALELAELAEEMVELRLRRLHPEASDGEIEGLVIDWLCERPGAPFGDSFGEFVKLPRT